MPELMTQSDVAPVARESGAPRIRIMHVVHRLATGGTEKNLRKLLAGLEDAAFEQTVCTVMPEVELEVGKTRVVSLGCRQGKPGFLVPQLVRVFRRERPDIVHSRNWGTIEAVVAARLAGVPAVIHSEHGRDVQTMGHQPWRRRMFRRCCYRWADRVFAVSRELAGFYSVQLGISADRLQIIPNGVDTSEFRPHSVSRIEFRHRLGVRPETLIVGAVSRLDPIKDHVTLLRAAELATARGIDLRLVIVGEGVCRPLLERELQARPALAARVSLIGEVSNVADWLNSFDVFVLPSLSEGMSNTLLEAMAVGVPPVATRVGGNPEVIEEGRSGVLFAPGDYQELAACLVRMAAEPEWRRHLAEACRLRVATSFALPNMLQAYARMYNDVLTAAGRRKPTANGSGR